MLAEGLLRAEVICRAFIDQLQALNILPPTNLYQQNTPTPLLKERRIPPADDDIKVIGLFHIRRLRVAGPANVAFKRVAHQDCHRVACVVRLPRKIHLGDQPR